MSTSISTRTAIQDVTCRRSAAGVDVSIPQSVVHHSPAGFEWGYGGSGPADLALNILAAIFPGDEVKCFRGRCSETAWSLHQEFKWKFVAALPRDGGVIRAVAVEHWLGDRGPLPQEGRVA